MNFLQINISNAEGVSFPFIPLQRGKGFVPNNSNYELKKTFERGFIVFHAEKVFRVSPFGGGLRGRIYKQIIVVK